MRPTLPPACTIRSPTGERCWATQGHEGLHGWEYCTADYGDDSAWSLQCEKVRGHDGQHHAEADW